MRSGACWYTLFFLITLICSLLLFSCKEKESEVSIPKYPAQVCDIGFDPEIDEIDFQPCDEDWIQQHYSFRDLYKGGKDAIEKAFIHVNRAATMSELNGYITIRFIVNCKQETGRFRVQEMNLDYQPTHFPAELIDVLLMSAKGLDKWQPAKYKDRVYDYYQYLTFKISAGQIAAILP